MTSKHKKDLNTGNQVNVKRVSVNVKIPPVKEINVSSIESTFVEFVSILASFYKAQHKTDENGWIPYATTRFAILMGSGLDKVLKKERLDINVKGDENK